MRETLEPAVLATCIKEHAAVDVDDALQTVERFLSGYTMPGGVVLNLQAARKQLQTASSHMAAALLIAEREGR
jgi:hypothetical protein